MNTVNKDTTGNDFNRLVNWLKTEDSSYSRLSRVIQISYLIFIPVFFILTIRDYRQSEDIYQLLGGGFMVLAFLIFALFFGKYYREYKFVDYSLPTIIMLKQAAYRYKPFQGRTVWIVLALALMDTGLFFRNKEDGGVLEFQVLFLGAILFGLAVGLLIWYFKYKPLRDEALRMIADIEEK